jgi:hypothetical protein
MAGIKLEINGIPTTTSQGIIFAEGNIFIKDGVNFRGVIASQKNIVITGTANITHDQNVMNDLFDLTSAGDVNITGLFDIISYEIANSPKPKNQRLQTKTIDIVEFKRIII